jgi:hypothetical protein
MTNRQIEKLADTANQLGVAAVIGGVGDAVLSGARIITDIVGICLGAGMLWFSLYFLGLLGQNGSRT